MSKSNPANLKYTKDHEWALVEGDIVTVGITDHAQELLTEVVFAELPAIGKKVEQGKQLAAVESVKSVSDVYSPVSGEVVEVNTELEANPGLINQDAFGAGWIAKVKMSNPAELEKLMDVAAYGKVMES